MAEYCAIGETITRFFSVMERTVNGVNIGGIGSLGATAFDGAAFVSRCANQRS